MSVVPTISASFDPPTVPPAGLDVSLDPAFLAELVAGLAAAEGLWRPHTVHDAAHRGSVRLVATDAYEVWLLGWTPGQGVELHDHGGSAAALQVVDGELLEVRLDGDHELTHHRLPTGSSQLVEAGTVHDIVNVSTTAATSLHAYSPPLSSMTYYDPISGAPTRTAPVDPEPAVVSGPTLARAVHPASAARSAA